MRKAVSLLVGLALLAIASAALAFHCPQDMKAIDDKLATKPALTQGVADQVTKLRAEGEALHKAGKHEESLKALGEAKRLLGI